MKYLASLLWILLPFSTVAVAQDTAVPPVKPCCCSKTT